MPIYEYRCDNGHTFEVMQRIIEEPLAKCQVCGAPVQRVFHPVAVHFKGSGFYNTDYGTRRRQRETAAAAEGKKESSDSSSSNGRPDTAKKKEAGAAGKAKAAD